MNMPWCRCLTSTIILFGTAHAQSIVGLATPTLMPRLNSDLAAVISKNEKGDESGCMGKVIGPHRVLTAAHCIQHMADLKIFVSPIGPEPIQHIDVTGVHLNPQFQLEAEPLSSKGDLAALDVANDLPHPSIPLREATWPDLRSGEFESCGIAVARINDEHWTATFLPMSLDPNRWDQTVASLLYRWFLNSIQGTEDVAIVWPVARPLPLDGGAPYICRYKNEDVQVGVFIGAAPAGYAFVQNLFGYEAWLNTAL